MTIEIILYLFIISLGVLSVVSVEEKLRCFNAYKVKRFFALFSIFSLISIFSAFIWNTVQYKIHFNREGTFFNTVVLAKISEAQSQPPFRLFPNSQTDVKDPNFQKKLGIQAMLVEENYRWVVKFIDPFSKAGDDIVAGAVMTAFVDKGGLRTAHGDIFGTELDIDIYLAYNASTKEYDRLTAYVTNEKTHLNTDKILRCSLERVKNKDVESILASGRCYQVESAKLSKLGAIL